MNTLAQLCSHYFAIPFAITLILPERRALAAAILPLPLVLWASLTGENHTPAGVVVLAFAGGLLSGVGARRLVAALPKPARNAAPFALAGSTALLLLPGSMAAEVAGLAHAANVKLRGWETRPPSSSCFARTYAVSVAGATYRLPAAPIFSVHAGRNTYHFQFNKSVRTICEAGPSHKPVHAENVSLDFSIPMRGTFCETAASGWTHELCGRAPSSARGAYPAIVNIYSPAQYDPTHLMSARSYADFIRSRDRASAGGHPLEPQQVGVFDRYAGGYWVARKGAWTNDAGEPFTLHCTDALQAGILRCTSSYRLPSGPQLSYHFNAPANRLEAVAKEVDRNIHSMLAELSAA